MVRIQSHPNTVKYPEEDDQVMESAKHAAQYADLLTALRAFFAARTDVFVGGNNFVYYQQGDPTKSVGPDIFVAVGVRPRRLEERGSYRIWEEGVPPTVIVELTSASTRRVDMVQKPRQYAALGVREYYLFDPLGDFLKPPLLGYHLTAAGQYDRLPPGELGSPALGLHLLVQDGWLRLRNSATGALLPTLQEAEQALAARGAELAEAEKTLALQDAEIARLRAELARLRGGP